MSAAHAAYATHGGIAGISLQRQAGRLDSYPHEIRGGSNGRVRQKPGPGTAALAALELDVPIDSTYLFPHVGSWGFSPEPKIWHAFLEWFASLGDAINEEVHWTSFVEGGENDTQAGPRIEALPSRWYRRALHESRGEIGLLRDGGKGHPRGNEGQERARDEISKSKSMQA